jgi:hypothetical protein
VAGPGPGPDNPPDVRAFPPKQDGAGQFEFRPYGTAGFGVNVACGDVTGDGFDEVITGPGPGGDFGPHVRGFGIDGSSVTGLNFLAYGTGGWGVNAACGDIDADGRDEIITGPGPGKPFGPNVRAFDYGADQDPPAVTPVAGVNFVAYGTRRWGVIVAAADIDGDGLDEILTGPGPGPEFGPHIRGWDVDGGPAAAVSGVSFFAYTDLKFGCGVSGGDIDRDQFDEIITAPGPSAFYGARVRGWDYDADALTSIPEADFFAWPSGEARYGARVFAGEDLDGDGNDEIVACPGPDPAAAGQLRVFRYDGLSVTTLYSLQAFSSPYGALAAAGRFQSLP